MKWEQLKESTLKRRFAPFPFLSGLRSISDKSISFSPVPVAVGNALDAFLSGECLAEMDIESRAGDAYARGRYPMKNMVAFKKEFP